jgi:hypothetical protein
MAPTPAELIVKELQAQRRPDEDIENGPGGSLYLAQKRFFVAKYNPMEQAATVVPFAYTDTTGARVETGQPQGDKPPSWFVEIGLKDRPIGGLAGSGGDEVVYSQKPNVIYCGRGPEAERLARTVEQVLRARYDEAMKPPPAAAPPPPPPPPPPSGVPADWYPDPKGVKRLRYWDGSAWTDHTAD